MQLIGNSFGTGLRSSLRQRQTQAHHALVFTRHKGGRRDLNHLPARRNDSDQNNAAGHSVVKRKPHPALKEFRKTAQTDIEALEEFRRFLGSRFKQNCAKRGRQRQCDKTGKRHRNRNRDGKLTVKFTGHAAQESHRHKHSREHQNNGHQRTRHFLHGALGRSSCRDPLGHHDAFDVFQHHNGIVNHDTDGKRHGKKRQRVERKVENPKAHHRADQRHGNSNHRNQSGAPTLQE